MKKIRHISVHELRLGMYIDGLGVSWLKHPFVRSSFLLTDSADLNLIRESGIRNVRIDEARGMPLHINVPTRTPGTDHIDHAAQTPDDAEAEVDIEVTEPAVVDAPVQTESEASRARRICDAAKEQVVSMFQEARLGKAIDPDATIPLVREIADSLHRDPTALISVARLKTHDDYTYLHSVAVCALMIGLARQLGLNEDQARMAGLGGLMHDIGKAGVPLDILNKPGRLSAQEYECVKAHCALGGQILLESDAPHDVQLVSLYHHEKMNGGGYPSGVKGHAIPLLARMGAICDVYDAVTSARVYKQPWDPAYAMREMAHWNGHFDERIFSAFVKSVGIYPVGSLVRLASDLLAVVTHRGERSLLKPVVRVFYSARTREALGTYSLDLADPACNDKIANLEDPAQWDFPNLHELWQ